jgi:4-amino-4-deoxy-L-arabinose transferase-like glycosyltransferase
MRAVLLFQGVYYLITGIWPLVSLGTFEAVTGPKTDDWLVQTVGVLAGVIGIVLLIGSLRRRPTRETWILSTISAIGFTAVNVTFVMLGVISRIYVVDAAMQIFILLSIALAAIRTATAPHRRVSSPAD